MTIISGVVITSMALITDKLNIKSFIFRKIEEGEPVILIEKGKLLYENLSKVKISISKLLMLLRQKDIFDIEDVDYAIFETDGYLTVLLKPEKLPTNAGDMKISKPENKLSADVIIDGKVILDSLISNGYTQDWLLQELHNQGITRPDQVFYASINKTGKLYIALFHTK